MMKTGAVYCCASDDVLEDMIVRARRRLLIVGPALTERVARTLLGRIKASNTTKQQPVSERLQITVVLDDKAETYRLGYGSAFERLGGLCDEAERGRLRFRVEPGVRIGVLVSDEDAVVFSPVPQLVEEPPSPDSARRNGIALSGREAERLARASGWEPPADRSPGDARTSDAAPGETPTDDALTREDEDRASRYQQTSLPLGPEIGAQPFTEEAVKAVAADLTDNPPQPFDLARRIRVFSSRVQYVELKVSNALITARKGKLPAELLGIVNDDLRKHVGGDLRPPAELRESFRVEIETAVGRQEEDVDSKWFQDERRRIEDEYTYIVPKYGRLLFRTERAAFEAATERLERNLKRYWEALSAAADASQDSFVARLVEEFLPNLRRNPPKNLTRYTGGGHPSEEDLRSYLRYAIQEVVAEVLAIAPPQVDVVYKNVAPESVDEEAFKKGLRASMKKRVPPHVIDRLFESGDAVPAQESRSGTPSKASA